MANGAVFNVAPIRGDLGAGKASEVFTVSNDGGEPVVVQAEINAWKQSEGRDEYAATRELLITPPIFTLPAHGEQIVRVGLRRPPDAQRELSYRLFLKEVPGDPRPGFQGVRMALHISLPIFVAPVSGAAMPALRWRVEKAANGALQVRLNNTGNAHIRISDLRLEADGKVVAVSDGLVYVLPEQSREWRLRPIAGASVPARLHLRALSDGAPIDEAIIIEK